MNEITAESKVKRHILLTISNESNGEVVINEDELSCNSEINDQYEHFEDYHDGCEDLYEAELPCKNWKGE